MLTISGNTSWKRAFIQTTHTMPRGANVIFICPILMAMSFHLLVRCRLKSYTSENCRLLCGCCVFFAFGSATKYICINRHLDGRQVYFNGPTRAWHCLSLPCRLHQ